MITGKEVLGAVGSYGNTAWNGLWPGMGMAGGKFPMFWAFSLFVGIVWLGIWIYTSFAYMEIARKLKYKNPWLAWIPFARSAMILQLGGFPWGWVFLWSPVVLFPLMFLGIWWLAFASLLFTGVIAFSVLCYISHWRFFEKRGYYGWLALTPLAGIVLYYLSVFAGIAFLVILGFVAWKDGNMVKRPSSRMPRAPQRRSSSRNPRSRGSRTRKR